MKQLMKELGKKAVGLLPTKLWLSWRFKQRVGYKMDWKNPKTFNQKLQWLKVYDRNPLYTTMVDKYEVKKYVADIIGEEYIIPTLGVWNNFDEIDFDALPNQFVLKCTHDSGGLVIVRDKEQFDKDAARKKLSAALKRNPYTVDREWPYKNVKPRIIAEQYMEDKNGIHLSVYKIFTFGGEPRLIQAIQDDKTENESIDYFDLDWNRLDVRQNFNNSKCPLSKPKTLDKMLCLSRQLAASIPTFLRTDFYEINEKVYFSEFTFFSDAGMEKFYPAFWDDKLGELINLPKTNR